MASYHAAAARRRRATGPAPSLTGPASDVHPVLRRATAPPAALDLLAQARAGLDEASALETSNERYATAHLAALRTAAAVLAARGRPEPTPRRRAKIRSAWEVLPEIAPELTEWSALFASGARRRARAEAGIQGRPAAGTRTTSYATWRCSCASSSGCWCSSPSCPNHARTRTGPRGRRPHRPRPRLSGRGLSAACSWCLTSADRPAKPLLVPARNPPRPPAISAAPWGGTGPWPWHRDDWARRWRQ